MVVVDWAWSVTESSLHSPYKGLWASLGNLPYVYVTEQFNVETAWPIAFESNCLQSNNSKRVTPFIPRFDLIKLSNTRPLMCISSVAKSPIPFVPVPLSSAVQLIAIATIFRNIFCYSFLSEYAAS